MAKKIHTQSEASKVSEGIEAFEVFETSSELRRQLRERLLGLNFHAFANCMALVIEKMGGEDVRLTGRRNWKGRNQHGGYDLEATLPSAFGLGKRRVIIQIKQYDAMALYQRSIDELRGTCLRVGASEAILITTGTFAPSVDRSLLRLQESLVAPVRLIDGEALLDLMLRHRIGIKAVERSNASNPASEANDQIVIADIEDVVDGSLFDTLAQMHSGNSRLDCGGTRFLVRVQVQPLRRRTSSAGGDHNDYQTHLVSAQGTQVTCVPSTDCIEPARRRSPLHCGTKSVSSSTAATIVGVHP